jgi:Uma2 family endonuclease
MVDPNILTLPDIIAPPTEEQLTCDDGIPMETQRHKLQMDFLVDPLADWLSPENAFVGGNMFVYFSPQQVKTHDYRGPDVFVVLDVPRRERKSWVVWEEGKAPDVVIELLSESTAQFDKQEKKTIYQDRLRVPEYFWFDPFNREDLAGFSLRDGVYEPIQADTPGKLISRQLNLALVVWAGSFKGVEAIWLRWATLEGELLPTEPERAEQERQRAEQERQRAEQERQRAEQERQRAEQECQRAEQERQRAEQEKRRAQDLEALLNRYRERFGDLPE